MSFTPIPYVRPRLGCVAASHAAVDFLSALPVPILTVLEGRLHLTPAQGALLLAVGSIASGVVQPAAAWWSDRYNTRVFGWLGLVVAAAAIGSFGYAWDFTSLVVLQILGTAGVGAFHPVGASAMGHLSGLRRSLGISVFYVCGIAGGIIGSLTSPRVAGRYGVEAFAWFVPASLVVALVLWLALRHAPHRHHDAHARHSELPPEERRARWTAVALLFAGNALRFIVNMALVTVLVRWTELRTLERAGVGSLTAELRTQASQMNGPLQAAMLVGMGFTGLTVGAVVRRHHERGVLVWIPILGSASIAALPHSSALWHGLVLSAAAGAAFGGVMPTTISLAQRLLPHRTSLASALMMGGAWSLAALGPPAAQALFDALGSNQTALDWTAAAVGMLLSISGALGLLIRRGAFET